MRTTGTNSPINAIHDIHTSIGTLSGRVGGHLSLLFVILYFIISSIYCIRSLILVDIWQTFFQLTFLVLTHAHTICMHLQTSYTQAETCGTHIYKHANRATRHDFKILKNEIRVKQVQNRSSGLV